MRKKPLESSAQASAPYATWQASSAWRSGLRARAPQRASWSPWIPYRGYARSGNGNTEDPSKQTGSDMRYGLAVDGPLPS